MANVTPISAVDSKVEYSTSGSGGWVDMSGFVGKIELSGYDRDVADNYVFNVDNALITLGKKKHVEVTITGAYNSGSVAGNPLPTATTAFSNKSAFHVRWAPIGLTTGSAGSDQWTSGSTGLSRVIAPVYPTSLDASSADGVLFEIKLAAEDVTKGTM